MTTDTREAAPDLAALDEPRQVLPGAWFVFRNGQLFAHFDGFNLPVLPEEEEQVRLAMATTWRDAAPPTRADVEAARTPAPTPPPADPVPPVAATAPSPPPEAPPDPPAAVEAIDVGDAWRYTRDHYMRVQADAATRHLHGRLEAVRMTADGREDCPWGRGREFRSRRQAVQAVQDLIAGVDPGRWGYEHACAVRDALADGRLTRDSAVLNDYPYLRGGPPVVEADLSAQHLITIEDGGDRRRASFTLDDGTPFQGPWVADDADRAVACALDAFAGWWRRHHPYAEMSDGESYDGLHLSRLLHPYTIPAGRVGVVADGGAGREYRILPVATAGGVVLFGAAARRPDGRDEMLGLPWGDTYNAACRILGAADLPADTRIVDPVAVEAARDRPAGPPEPDPSAAITLSPGDVYYANLERSASRAPLEVKELKLSVTKQGVSAGGKTVKEKVTLTVNAEFSGELALHRPLTPDETGVCVTHAASGLLIRLCADRREARTLVYILTGAGIDWKKLPASDRERAKHLTQCFMERRLPDDPDGDHAAMQTSLFDAVIDERNGSDPGGG